jgi:hypothetical protein
MGAENLDNDAQVTVTARIQHVLARAYSLDDLAHVKDGCRHGALPVPLVARPLMGLCHEEPITPRDITVTQWWPVH